MADSIFSTSTMADHVAKTFHVMVPKLLNRAAPLLAVLPKRAIRDITYNWTCETNGQTPAIISQGGAYADSTFDQLITPSMTLYQVGTTFSITDIARAVSVEPPVNQFVSLLGNAVAATVGNGSASIGYYMVSGTGSSQPAGLEYVISESNTSYGIDQSSVTSFAGNEVNCSGGALTEKLVMQGFTEVMEKSGGRPDILACSPKSEQYLAELGLNRMRLTETSEVHTFGGSIKLGYKTVQFNGVPVIADQSIPDGYIYGLDSSAVEFVYLPPVAANADEYVIDAGMDERTMVQGIPFLLRKVPTTTTAAKYGITSTGALRVGEPGRCFKVWNFVEPS